MVIHPRIPILSVANATLGTMRYSQSGLLETQMTIIIRAENDNTKAHASFSDTAFILSFQGLVIAKLVADPFDVKKNSSIYFNYEVTSDEIPLDSARMHQVDLSLKKKAEVVSDTTNTALSMLPVIITGIAVFIGYMVIHPRIPTLSVANAHLDTMQYSQAGLLETAMNIIIRAENDNTKAHASFSDTSFILSFQGLVLAKLVADPFDVSKNSSIDFNYVVTSSEIPLDSARMHQVDLALKQKPRRFFFWDSFISWILGHEYFATTFSNLLRCSSAGKASI
nr:hypothetical protein CFP56_65787 [Quercus suber]